MPTIVMANPKGGAGKSTSCLVLGTSLASRGAKVRIIDADPQQTIGRWAKADKSRYASIVDTTDAGGDLTDVIDRATEEAAFVLIDLQGSANQEMAAAMSRADLVIIPMQAKTADAEVSSRAIGVIRSQEKLFKREIRHGVLFMRTSPLIPTREEKDIVKSIDKAEIPRFQVSLNERVAFSQMFAQKLALDELNEAQVNGLQSATENAMAFAAETLALLKKDGERAA